MEESFSTTDGEYVFYNLTAGLYRISTSNDDYILSTDYNISINDKVNLREILYLDKLSQTKEGIINGRILDKFTNAPIQGAFVGLYELNDNNEETLIKVTTTNYEGKYFFGTVLSRNMLIRLKLWIN